MEFDFYTTGDSGELAASIPITASTPYQLVPIYKLEIPNVKAGDLLDISAYGQVSNNNGVISNPTGTNVMFCHVVRGGLPGQETREFTEARGCNVDRLRHHEDWQITTTYRSLYNYSTLSLIVFGYSASSIAQPGWVLTVDKDCGRLQVKHWYTPAVLAAE